MDEDRQAEMETRYNESLAFITEIRSQLERITELETALRTIRTLPDSHERSQRDVSWKVHISKIIDDNSALRERIARLEGALEEIVRHDGDGRPVEQCFDQIIKTARKALAQ